MEKQNGVAKEIGLSFFMTADEIREAIDRGDLVELKGNDDYAIADFVSHPYAVPAVRTFVERLSSQYRASCGEKLVVTSATRATSKQPSNASQLSVHPAGMALDLRVSDDAACRKWLETTVLSLERARVIDAIREYHPPHYHVAIYPEAYMAYVDERIAEERAEAKAEKAKAAERDRAAASAEETATADASASARDEGSTQAGPGVLLALVLTGLVWAAAAAATRQWWLPRTLPHVRRIVDELASLRLRLNRGES